MKQNNSFVVSVVINDKCALIFDFVNDFVNDVKAVGQGPRVV